MFVTLAGSYPDAAADPAGILADQVDAGVGILSDGIVHAPDEGAAALAAAWRATVERLRALVPEVPEVHEVHDAPDAPDSRPVKLALSGPWAGGVADPARFGAILGALAEAGCPYVEVHEPAGELPRTAGDISEFGSVLYSALRDVPPGLHVSLAITGGNADHLPADVLFATPFASYLFDLVAGPENWRQVAIAPGDRGIVVGVADATGRLHVGLEEITWASRYAASTQGRGLVRVGIAPTADLAGLGRARARRLLAELGSAAALLAGDNETLLDAMDPRAIDARTAALGHEARRALRRGAGPDAP